jgi:hypothetical protein
MDELQKIIDGIIYNTGRIQQRLVRYVAKDSVINGFNQANMTSFKEIMNRYKRLYGRKNSGVRGNSEAKALSVRSVTTQTLSLQTREINNKGCNKLFNREDPQVNKRKKSSPAEDTNSEVCKAKEYTNKE